MAFCYNEYMNALLLPGNSPRHAVWIEELGVALAGNFDTIKTQHYHHWQTRAKWADVGHEIVEASNLSENLDPYVIVGKSIGTVIAARATAEGILRPEKLILLGVPINGGADSKLFIQWLRKITVPVVILQNTSDPLGSYADIETAFGDVSANVTLVQLPGDTHDYLDFAAVAKQI